ncbi:site-specific integrase [Pedobacter roseus]|uniref:Site-specific integrase n=1 Tax=Pedobacter roseus TaxID=336820 RepID=A0A7G9QNE9_9SPHI|nr:site-specific integrase [Pedobacter roseus]QNN44874.1 site-specific integrase [Pedobacter roseus]
MSKVTLRSKKIGKGRKSLFLDIYPPVINPDTGKLQRKHYLKIFLYGNPNTTQERFHNKETLELARTEAALRQVDVQNLRFGFLSQRMLNGNFIEFFELERSKRPNNSNSDNWKSAISYFKAFVGEKILFPQLNETLCEEYADYLLSAPAIGRAGRPIKINTAYSYFAKFKATLKVAFKKRLIPVNLGQIIDSITPEDTHREFLFQDELQILADTPCDSDVVKRTSLFSVLTGLRFSDCLTLDWSEIRGSKGRYFIQFSIDKTRQAEYHPISDQAVTLLGNREVGIVFKGLSYHLADRTLPGWLKMAGIGKHITFHCFRHTFATLQLLFGTDIVTLSKLLGHKNIKTTMIYVKIVDKLKRDASDRIRIILDDKWLNLKNEILVKSDNIQYGWNNQNVTSNIKLVWVPNS